MYLTMAPLFLHFVGNPVNTIFFKMIRSGSAAMADLFGRRRGGAEKKEEEGRRKKEEEGRRKKKKEEE